MSEKDSIMQQQKIVIENDRSVRRCRALQKELTTANLTIAALRATIARQDADLAEIRRELADHDKRLEEALTEAARNAALAGRCRHERRLLEAEKGLLLATMCSMKTTNARLKKRVMVLEETLEIEEQDLHNTLCTMDTKCTSDSSCRCLAADTRSMPRFHKLLCQRTKLNEWISSHLGLSPKETSEKCDPDFDPHKEARIDPQLMMNEIVKLRFGGVPPEDWKVMLCLDGRATGKQSQADSVLALPS